MEKFLKRLFWFLFIGSIPLIVLIILYVILDPFKVVHEYDDYSYMSVIPNRDFISTEMFNKNKDKYKYNSFILGSSRTLAFKPQRWKSYLSDTAEPFMFDASGETLWGIHKKLLYLDSTRTPIKNALIVLCRDCSFSIDHNFEDHLSIHHPAVTHESMLLFQWTFLDAYFSTSFLSKYYLYKITKKYTPWMKGYLENRSIKYNTRSNELQILDQDAELARDTNQYYEKRKDQFYKRPEKEQFDSVTRIKRVYSNMLLDIKRILVKNKTKYKVVISPLYEQIKINGNDLTTLKAIFGNNLYDFSGKNYFTQNPRNYYEHSHYRPSVGDSIINIIYNY